MPAPIHSQLNAGVQVTSLGPAPEPPRCLEELEKNHSQIIRWGEEFVSRGHVPRRRTHVHICLHHSWDVTHSVSHKASVFMATGCVRPELSDTFRDPRYIGGQTDWNLTAQRSKVKVTKSISV